MPNIEELNNIVKKLQEIMRIQDWDIEVAIANKYEIKDEIDDDNIYGVSIRHMKMKTAKILLNKDHHPEEWYATLVHELKHIQSSDMLNEMKKNMNDKQFDSLIYYEQLTEILTKEFITLYPQK